MNELALSLDASDWLTLFLHICTLSLLAVGGVIAQAAPGPNVLFVALMGWNVGLNVGGYATAALGLTATLFGILLPSTTVTYLCAQWGHRNRHLRGVRAFKQGMAPIVVALLGALGRV